MYEKIIILTVLLFSGYSSSQETTESEGTESLPTEAMTHASPSRDSTALPPFNIPGSEQLEHIFSAGEITGIVYAVMVGVVGTILSIAFCVKQLTKKSPPTPVQPAHPEDADPESSIEPRNPEQ